MPRKPKARKYTYRCQSCRTSRYQITLPSGWGPDHQHWRCRACQEGQPLTWDDVLLHIDTYRAKAGESKMALCYAMGKSRAWWTAVVRGSHGKPALETIRAVLVRYDVPASWHPAILATYEALESPSRRFCCSTPGCISKITARQLPKTWHQQGGGRIMCSACLGGEAKTRGPYEKQPRHLKATKRGKAQEDAGAGVVEYSTIRIGGDEPYKARRDSSHIVRINHY